MTEKPENIARRMRETEQGVLNDAAPATQTGGASGSGRKPPQRPVRGGDDEAEWAGRQAALRSKTNGEELDPHEIEFLERFEALGYTADWIPKAPLTSMGRKPTNDFHWTDRGWLVCELKSTSAKYQSIKNHIHEAVAAAARQHVVKDRFVVDIGTRRLMEKLRHQLELYNVKTTSTPIKELWVLAEEGRTLTRIDLK